MYDKNGGDLYKFLTVAKLRNLLAELDGDWRIYPNHAQNLLVVRAEDDAAVAFIDVLQETVKWYAAGRTP